MYTNKDVTRVVIVMFGYRIEGDFHLLAGSRLTDALNSKSKDFFAITNAKVFGAGREDAMYAPSYVAVNRDDISCIFPLDEN